jgi:hypothetical protein
MQKLVPEVILTDPHREGMLTVDYIELIPVAMRAIQEQQKILEQQEARIASLERGRALMKSSLSSEGAGDLEHRSV